MPRLGTMLQRVPEDVLDAPLPPGAEEVNVTGVHHDSRTVRKDGLFVALRGLTRDGQDFVPQAEGNGAAFIVSDRSDFISFSKWLKTANPRRALAHLACAFYGHPSRDMEMVGVTGTNGKTSVCWFLRDAWHALGLPCASLGTLGVTAGDPETASSLGPVSWPTLTTPEAPNYQATLAELRGAGLRHVACEVSSHALAMDRTLGTHFKTVVFTNLGRDHLDFHGSAGAYREAKWKLFQREGREAVDAEATAAVLNVDDPVGRSLEESLLHSPRETDPSGIGWKGREAGVITYGLNEEHAPWILGEILESSVNGLSVEARWPRGRARIRTGLLGTFHASHLLAGLGVLMALGTPGEEAAAALSRARRVPGRMEPIGEVRDALVVVDFAHSPEALETALRECRALAEGRLLVVFGCGGDRDRGKRPLMGSTAGRMADEVIVTTDNPRSEDPTTIAGQVTEGVRATSAHLDVILDRRKALAEGIAKLKPGDVLLVAGRGAETVQIIGDRRIPFDDREVLRELIGASGSCK